MNVDLQRVLYTEFGDFAPNTPNQAMPNGPLCGGGDVGITLDMVPGGLRLWFGKNDFWCYRPAAQGGGVKSPAYVTVVFDGDVPTVRLWQDGRTGRIGANLSFADGAAAQVTVCAPRGQGCGIIRMACRQGQVGFAVTADALPDAELATVDKSASDHRVTVTKRYTGQRFWRDSAVAACLRGVNAPLKSTLREGQSAAYMCQLISLEESENPTLAAESACSGVSEASLTAMEAANDAWWADFWQACQVHLPDYPDIERTWYLSHYIMATCCDRSKFAPGLFGPFITTDAPNWQSDYHFNYNHEAPFWGLYSSNHVDIADVYDKPVLEYMPQAQANAMDRLNCRGLYARVGIGPHGYEVSATYRPDGTPIPDGAFYGQKSNASYGGVNFIMRYYSTLDQDYLREKAYPYLKQVMAFWQDYLTYENGVYNDYEDCIHESETIINHTVVWTDGDKLYCGDKNPIVSIALIRVTLKALLDMSATLGVDEALREKWTHMLHHLPHMPTQQRDGSTVFRYSEQGMAWCDSNSLGIQNVFPAGDITLDSDEALLALARSTHTALNRWEDYNAFPTFFTAAARLGMNPDDITANMQRQIATHGYPNGVVYYGGGGIEDCSAVPSAINDMLAQNYAGRLRLFPVWNRAHDAAFENLRLYGALLVSASLTGGVVGDVRITAEKGGTIHLVNPWQGDVTVTCGGRQVPTATDERGDIIFRLMPGETCAVQPK